MRSHIYMMGMVRFNAEARGWHSTRQSAHSFSLISRMLRHGFFIEPSVPDKSRIAAIIRGSGVVHVAVRFG
jgi:hypothetical protein